MEFSAEGTEQRGETVGRMGATSDLDKCRREGEDANDHNHRVYRRQQGTTKGNPYQVGTEEWAAWRDGYAYRDMVNDG
jgi:hypothetical protein